MRGGHDGDGQEVILCPRRDVTDVTTLRTVAFPSLQLGMPRPVTASCIQLCHPVDPEQSSATPHVHEP